MDQQIGTWIQDLVEQVQGNKTTTVDASGVIQADEIHVASELGGRITAVHVHKGDLVEPGDLLVVLDDTKLQTMLSEAQAAEITARANLALLQAGPSPEAVAARDALLALAEAKSTGAEVAWQNALAAVHSPQALDAEISQAQTSVNLAEQGVVLAEAELAKQRLIADQKQAGTLEHDIAAWQVSAAEASLDAAQADLAMAKTLLEGLIAIRSWPLGLIVQANMAEGQFKIEQAGVMVAQAERNDLAAGPTKQELAVAEQTVQFYQAQVEALRSQLAKFELHSPMQGIVLKQTLLAGELAAPAATIMTIADLRQVTLIVYVPVTQLGQIQQGQTVQVRVDSFADRVFEGQVIHIGDQPEYTPRNVATQEERLNTFYAVEIRIENINRALKPGMPADVRF